MIAKHEPVLLEEVLKILDPKSGDIVVDATVGSGGHAAEILKRLGPKGRLIGIDQDPEAIERTKESLKMYPQVELIQANFTKLEEILSSLNLNALNAVLLDIGVSTEQLEEPRRGFSFLKEGPLDMRMDPESPLAAHDLTNELPERELEKLFQVYGEERWARRIARAIERERSRKRIETTGELARLIARSVPPPYRYGPRHPAMRVFQALRIRVNDELGALETVLPKALKVLRIGGRLGVICFHSLEDRIVKQTFRAWKDEGKARLLTAKPIRPSETESEKNPRARSARLRGIEKLP